MIISKHLDLLNEGFFITKCHVYYLKNWTNHLPKATQIMVTIELKHWDYTCGDGCCYEYGIKIIVNGVECDNEYAGDDVQQSIEFILRQLNIKHEII